MSSDSAKDGVPAEADLAGLYDEAQGLAFGPTVLERVLMAIIKAHTPSHIKDSDEARLKVAVAALTGVRQPGTPFKRDRYDKALLFIAKQRHIDECNVNLHAFKTRREDAPPAPPRIRSELELATLAAREILGFNNETEVYANAKALCEMFSGRHWQKGGKRTDVDFRRTYRFRAVEHDYVQDSLETEAVQRLCDELSKWDVPTRL